MRVQSILKLQKPSETKQNPNNSDESNGLFFNLILAKHNYKSHWWDKSVLIWLILIETISLFVVDEPLISISFVVDWRPLWIQINIIRPDFSFIIYSISLTLDRAATRDSFVISVIFISRIGMVSLTESMPRSLIKQHEMVN